MLGFMIGYLLLFGVPAADPGLFSNNSPQCIFRHITGGNLLPLIVRTEKPSCPWTPEEISLVEMGRFRSHY